MKNFLILIIVILLILSGSIYFRVHTMDGGHTNGASAGPPSVPPHPRLKVVLMPLDSRPPCTQFLEQLGNIAGVEMIVPPLQLLDNYRTPADKQTLRKWLQDNIKTADAAIISVDMLTHGGLLASRLSAGTQEDYTAVLGLLKSLHRENPNIKLYAFNIIPRLLLADSMENRTYQNNILRYSVLKDQVLTFENPLDSMKLQQLEQQIPADIITRYNALYRDNININTALADMAAEGILSGVVIGQDDGQPFGIPNINKQQIQHYIENRPALDGKIAVTRGTDEVALTLLGKIVSDFSGYQPRVFVMYSDDDGPRQIMPYMPNTVATTVQEKIKLIGGTQAQTMDAADFVLYVHVGTKKSRANLPSAWDKFEALLKQERRVALVDLSENFDASQTLLPFLLKNNINPARLIAYAGWNTTSNSIGTAVTQAALFTHSSAPANLTEDLINTYEYNLEFLTARFLDDWYYQKEVQPLVNERLKKYRIDSYNLGTYDQQTDDLIRKLMLNKSRRFFNQHLKNQSVVVQTSHEPVVLTIAGLKLETQLPWTRTFEIWLRPSLTFSRQ